MTVGSPFFTFIMFSFIIASVLSWNTQLFATVENEGMFRKNIIKLFLWYCKHSGDESHLDYIVFCVQRQGLHSSTWAKHTLKLAVDCINQEPTHIIIFFQCHLNTLLNRYGEVTFCIMYWSTVIVSPCYCAYVFQSVALLFLFQFCV